MLGIIGEYLQFGFTHVLPFGYDHVLFILALCVSRSQIKLLVLQCTVFTVAHSLAMVMASLGVVLPNAVYIEPLIAMSILFTAIENITQSRTNRKRFITIFVFGIVHGLGFASALSEIGLPKTNFVLALASFNFGVEAAQVLIIVLMYYLVIKWYHKKNWYLERIAYPTSTVIACIALILTITRIMSI